VSARLSALVSLAVLLGLGACVGNTALMTPGEDCIRCHSPGGGAHPFALGGTVYESLTARSDQGFEGATVHIVDAGGHAMDLITNSAGNFYVGREQVAFPLTVSVTIGGETRHMEPTISYGGCAKCHNSPPNDGAEGRVYVSPNSP
jgi:hypothetical protein